MYLNIYLNKNYHNTKYQIPNIKYQISNTKYQIPNYVIISHKDCCDLLALLCSGLFTTLVLLFCGI